MPLFEFTCEECGERFEDIVARDSAVSCPKCGASKVTKMFSAFAVGAGGGSSRSSRPAAAPAPT